MIRLESIGGDLAVRDVVAQDGVLDIASEGVHSGFQLRGNVGKGFVGRSEKGESLLINS